MQILASAPFPVDTASGYARLLPVHSDEFVQEFHLFPFSLSGHLRPSGTCRFVFNSAVKNITIPGTAQVKTRSNYIANFRAFDGFGLAPSYIFLDECVQITLCGKTHRFSDLFKLLHFQDEFLRRDRPLARAVRGEAVL